MLSIELVNNSFPSANLVIYHKNTKIPQIDSTKKRRGWHIFGAGLAGFFHVLALTITILILRDAYSPHVKPEVAVEIPQIHGDRIEVHAIGVGRTRAKRTRPTETGVTRVSV